MARSTFPWFMPFILAAIGSHPATAITQTIPVRTVPVASGDQFLTVPSSTLGMAGVRLAVDDSLHDPWVNPAKGVLVKESAFFGSPSYYSISNRGGGGRTFPLGAVFRGPRLFGGGALALQQIENDEGDGGCCWAEPVWGGPASPRLLSDASARNLYALGFFGVRLPGPWSIGMGFGASKLAAMDGVDLLYARAQRIEQSGATQDLRVGLYRVGDRDRLSLLLLHGRVSMQHEVTYQDWIWTPNPDPNLWTPPVLVDRVELNEDETHMWGGHVAWDRTLIVPGWRVGASATLNRLSHPKIPNYDIQDIPRDPGVTWAYEAALGFARTLGTTMFALDLTAQPIWSETWQEADLATELASAGKFRIGDRTIENKFLFTNVMMRAGLSHEIESAGFQLGLEARSYAYTLEQIDHVAVSFRDQDESWIEWTPSLGLVLRLSDLEIRYGARLTTGTGRPGVANDRLMWLAEGDAAGAANFILAPQGPLTLQDVDVVTQQISVRLPIK